MTKTKQHLSTFATGFIQVCLVALNTHQIAHEKYAGVFVVGTLISLVWTINVKRVAFGTWTDRLVYCFGAGCGSLSGLLISKLIY